MQRLRKRKRRDRKPFAVLFANLAGLPTHAEVSEAASQALRSPAAPIVLLKRRECSTLAGTVAPGLGTLGAFLAYTPLHRALIQAVGTPLVATSGNPTDEPMPVDNDAALAELGPIADGFLLHDRRILRHADDSVVRMIGGRPVPVRIGRGLAPVRIELPIEPPPLLATGGHLKAAIAFTRGRELFLGQHIGDLDTMSAAAISRERGRPDQALRGPARSRGPRPASRLFHHEVRAGDGPTLDRRPAPSCPCSGMPRRAWRTGTRAGDCVGWHGAWRRRHDLGR